MNATNLTKGCNSNVLPVFAARSSGSQVLFVNIPSSGTFFFFGGVWWLVSHVGTEALFSLLQLRRCILQENRKWNQNRVASPSSKQDPTPSK